MIVILILMLSSLVSDPNSEERQFENFFILNLLSLTDTQTTKLIDCSFHSTVSLSSISLKKLLYLLSQKVFSGLQSWVEVVGISTKTREKKKRKRKEQPNLCFGFSLLCFPFPLTKFNLSSLFGPILASFCDSAGLT